MKKYHLDKEEQEILDTIESGQWESVKPKKAELGYYTQIARNTCRMKRMNKAEGGEAWRII